MSKIKLEAKKYGIKNSIANFMDLWPKNERGNQSVPFLPIKFNCSITTQNKASPNFINSSNQFLQV
jgi:hypothetical protein